MPIPRILEGHLTLPVIGAPMFIVSGPELVIAQCKAGVVGSFPALNARPKEQLEAWIVRIKNELAQHRAEHPGARVAPFAVNQIAHRSNDRLEHDVEVCVRHEVPIIITSLRPPAEIVKAVHSYGGIVLHDVINVRHAEKAVEEGVDGLILVCAGAGGHAGTLSPFALVNEVRRFYQGTICLAGAISTGRDVLAAQSFGADLAYVGTRFIATEEANAMPEYKKMLVETTAKDIVYSSLFTGIHGNYLKPAVANNGLDPDNLPSADKSTMNFGSGGNMAAKAWRDIWSAGQGVGSITDAPRVETLVGRMRAEYDAAYADLAGRAAAFRG
ncbi:NAD(P)H-dependent flavin oxidoreductase [Polyangium spumosum]|uniref:Nitronate monooxygenase n=1 Tax=Polyangium spumosum TaxID=889282 RepID=A0A6N7PQC9_9BACT|nr:nitronate monooxygenase family protein [Polyangium spumosum]MRG93016.1 nitronate monooxygenase [Polyangium spumosum]